MALLKNNSFWENQFSTGFRDSTGHLNVTASQSAQIVSILSAGTFFGALGAAPIADRLGRRLSLIVANCVFTFGVILQTAATRLPSKYYNPLPPVYCLLNQLCSVHSWSILCGVWCGFGISTKFVYPFRH